MSALPACDRLVVGIDFSPASAAALRLAAAWAGSRRAALELVHVAPPRLPGEAEQPLREALERLSADQRALNQDLRCSTALLRGTQPADVLAGAATGGAWLVLGMEGSAAEPLRRAGRVTVQACHSDSAPVLLAPPRWRLPRSGRRLARPDWQRVLVGLSGGPGDRARLEAALELARPGRPAVLHVADASWARSYPPEARGAAARPVQEAAERWLEGFLELEDELVDVAGDGPELRLHLLRQGPAHRDLAGLAESQSMGLVLVGSGPTAGRLAALCDRPVLVLP